MRGISSRLQKSNEIRIGYHLTKVVSKSKLSLLRVGLQYHIAYDLLLKQFHHLFIMITNVTSFLGVHTSAERNEA